MGNQFNISNLTPDDVATFDSLTVNNNATVGGSIQVSGTTTLNGTLDVTDPATISDTLNVTGATTLTSTVSVTSAATLSHTLDVAGIASFADDVKLTTTAAILTIKNGTNAIFGTVTLSNGGRSLVYSDKLTANSVVFTTHNVLGGTAGVVAVGTLSNGAVSLNSGSGTDTSTIGWLIIDPS